MIPYSRLPIGYSRMAIHAAQVDATAEGGEAAAPAAPAAPAEPVPEDKLTAEEKENLQQLRKILSGINTIDIGNTNLTY